jgi:glucokinase
MMSDQQRSTELLLMGLDIGGTKIEALVVDQELTPRARVVVATQTSSPAALVQSIESAIERALAEMTASPAQIGAIGCGIPGQVEHAIGMVHNAVNLNLSSFPLGPTLSDRLGCAVVLENDVRLAAIGVYHWLRRTDPERYRSLEDLVYVSIGTGLAAGLILNGRIYRGSRGMAGELGHIPLDPTGARCNCGARGCVETIVSGPGLLRRTEEALAKAPQKTDQCARHTADPLTTYAILEGAAAGDSVALTMVDQFAEEVSRLLYSVMLAYDVEIIALGGGMANAGPIFHAALSRHIDALRDAVPLAHSLLNQDQLLPITEDNMGVWGGIMLAADALLHQEKKHDERQLRIAAE